MRSNNLNWHDHGGYTEITAPYLNVNVTYEDESKCSIVHKGLLQNFSTDEREPKVIIMHETLSQSWYTNKGKSKHSIVNEALLESCFTNKGESERAIVKKTLSQSCSTNANKSKHSIFNRNLSHNCSADKDESSSTENEKPECAIKKQREVKYEVPYNVTKYFIAFHVFECGRNILDRLDVTYERACMAIQSTISDYAYYNSEMIPRNGLMSQVIPTNWLTP